jgi:hypothetical protein
MGPAYSTDIPAVITTYNLFMAPYPRFTALLITAPTVLKSVNSNKK